mgnify:CR=1 FL=1
MSNLRERLKARLTERTSKKIEDDLDPELSQERKRRLAAIDGDSDLKKLRAVSGTTDTIVLNYAIENLSEIEVGCWAEILRSSSLEILEKAIARLKLIASEEFIATTFSAVQNKNISDKLFAEVIDLAVKNNLLRELFDSLGEKYLSIQVSKKLAKVFFDNVFLPPATNITEYGLPLYVNFVFRLKISNEMGYIFYVFSSLRSVFKAWAANTKDRRSVFQIGSMITCILPALVEGGNVVLTMSELVEQLGYMDNQEIKG